MAFLAEWFAANQIGIRAVTIRECQGETALYIATPQQNCGLKLPHHAKLMMAPSNLKNHCLELA